ncbi:MAG TPA: SRPBCC domain-containing protein [Acidobacteriaceae bacterium]|nr:SRPBCC domain-containing protein [Acidobacteriaceae bacterium]
MPALEAAPAPAASLSLTQTRVIRAPRARVFEAWTDPEMMQLWFSSASSISIDPRVGGSYRIEASPCEEGPGSEKAVGNAEPRVSKGQYTRIVPNELLQFTWQPCWSAGENSLVTVSLRDVPGGTELTLLHEKFASVESRDGHDAGWARLLDNLGAKLAG